MHRIINHFFLILIFFLSLVVFLNFPLKSVERLNAFFLSLASFFQVLLMFNICNFIHFLVLLFSSLFMESNFVFNINVEVLHSCIRLCAVILKQPISVNSAPKTVTLTRWRPPKVIPSLPAAGVWLSKSKAGKPQGLPVGFPTPLPEPTLPWNTKTVLVVCQY